MIDQCRTDFIQAKDGLARALATTPDDRLLWSPSATSRSPLHVAGHAAMAVRAMLGNLQGNPFPVETPEAAERYFRVADQQFQTREQVLATLEENGTEYLVWLERLTPEGLEASIALPFGLGSVPVSVGLTFMAAHLNWHTAQINYIQTIYGDQDWHLGD